MANILIIDDDAQLCTALSMVIKRMDHDCDTAQTIKDGLEILEAGRFEVVILDIHLPDGNGLEVLPVIRENKHQPEVIILSGTGDPDGAELAIRDGAWSYITKPPTLNKIKLPVQRALEYHHHKQARQRPVALKRSSIIGSSRALQRCLDTVAQAAATDANVLITGETGTGKELFARAIHDNSPRASGPFVVVDCAALPEHLVESMLFGHEKGAFTSADKTSVGLVARADSGTLFLDEVGELPMAMQKAFLRVLQDRRFRPIGGAIEQFSDFRLVAATNKDLEGLVDLWEFRQDLLFRLRTVAIELPPLRDRPGDIRELCDHAMDVLCKHLKIERKALSSEYLETLLAYSWPGNVRELFNALENALSMAGDEPVLTQRHLPMEIRIQATRDALSGYDSLTARGAKKTISPDSFPTIKEFRAKAIAELEKQYLRDLLATSGNDIAEALRLSGLSRARLYALMKAHGVKR